jgi:Zn-dependent protease with chaperone function
MGLVLLAAGRQLYPRMSAHEYTRQAQAESGFWTSFAEILSTHPHLPKRVRAVMDSGALPMSTVQPAVRAQNVA